MLWSQTLIVEQLFIAGQGFNDYSLIVSYFERILLEHPLVKLEHRICASLTHLLYCSFAQVESKYEFKTCFLRMK